MRAILALALKDLRILIRARSGIFFTFVWPLLVAVFFGVLFSGFDSGTPAIRIAIADEDGSQASRQFIARLKEGGNLIIDEPGLQEATALVRQGKRTAAVVIPKGFGVDSDRFFYGEPPKVEVLIDPSRKAESAMLEGLLFQQAAGNMQRLFSDREASKNMVQKSLKDLPGAPGNRPR